MWSGITIFYMICMALGFFFALMGALFGEIFGHGMIGGHGVEIGHGHGLELGHGDGIGAGHGVNIEHGHGIGSHSIGVESGSSNPMPGASVFNTITMSTFMAFFGGSGLICVWVFKLGALPSLALAIPTSLLIAAGQFILFDRVFIKAQASSEATVSEILGCEAAVISSIPGDRVGQITYVIKGSRFTAPAVSADGEDIPRGARVQVVNIRGGTLVVRPV